MSILLINSEQSSLSRDVSAISSAIRVMSARLITADTSFICQIHQGYNLPMSLSTTALMLCHNDNTLIVICLHDTEMSRHFWQSQRLPHEQTDRQIER